MGRHFQVVIVQSSLSQWRHLLLLRRCSTTLAHFFFAFKYIHSMHWVVSSSQSQEQFGGEISNTCSPPSAFNNFLCFPCAGSRCADGYARFILDSWNVSRLFKELWMMEVVKTISIIAEYSYRYTYVLTVLFITVPATLALILNFIHFFQVYFKRKAI